MEFKLGDKIRLTHLEKTAWGEIPKDTIGIIVEQHPREKNYFKLTVESQGLIHWFINSAFFALVNPGEENYISYKHKNKLNRKSV